MVSKGRRAAKELQRRKPTVDPRPSILVVCEGEVTEAEYLHAFKQRVRAVVNLVVVNKAGTPKPVVERAVLEKKSRELLARQKRDESIKYSEVWCVFDVDEHPYLPEARQQAKDNNLRVVISNPCFELWLLLHFESCSAWTHRHAAQSRCRELMPSYEKSPPLKTLESKYGAAVERARQLCIRNEKDGEPERNPSTNVHELTERLLALGQTALLASLTKK